MPTFLVSSDVLVQITTIINNESDSYTYSDSYLPFFHFSSINGPLAPTVMCRLFEYKIRLR